MNTRSLLFSPTRPAQFLTGMAALALAISAQAADKTWTSAAQNQWNSANWAPAGTPVGGDNIFITTGGVGNITLNSSPNVGNFSINNTSATQSLIGLNGGGGATLTISGTLGKTGTGTFIFRNSSATANPLSVDVNHVEIDQGTLLFGEISTNNFLSSFEADSVSASGSSQIGFRIGNTAGTATVNGALTLSGSSVVRVRDTNSTGVTGTLSVGSLVSSSTTTVVRVNGNAGNAATGTLELNNTSGVATYAGIIEKGGTAANVMNVVKNGAGTQVFSGNNTYNGTTVVNAGTLLVTGTHTGGAAYTVNGGTFGGAGLITTAGNAGITLESGAKLSAGAAAGTAGVLTANLGTGMLDLGDAVDGANTGALVFDLGTTSDQIILTAGTLAIGTGILEFEDFDFTAQAGFGAGTYVLFDTNSTISGTLGAGLSGTINGSYIGTLSLADSDTNLILTVAVIPEPSAFLLLAAGLTIVLVGRRRPAGTNGF